MTWLDLIQHTWNQSIQILGWNTMKLLTSIKKKLAIYLTSVLKNCPLIWIVSIFLSVSPFLLHKRHRVWSSCCTLTHARYVNLSGTPGLRLSASAQVPDKPALALGTYHVPVFCTYHNLYNIAQMIPCDVYRAVNAATGNSRNSTPKRVVICDNRYINVVLPLM